MLRSIAKRIYWTVFTACSISLVATVAVVLVGYEDLERSLLEQDFQAERDFVFGRIDRQAPLAWNTANLTAFYVPARLVERHPPPAFFRRFPFPFAGEVEIADKTFLVTLGEVSGGRLYIAKDISLVEQREALFERLLAAIGLGVIMLSLLLSHISARRLASPLQHLAAHIRRTPPGQKMPRIGLDFEDVELHSIGESFNIFLDELETFVKREQFLLSLASHELRTPIAVISGASDILEQRDRLSAEDKKTLQRIQRATAEMAANTEALLRLARRGSQVENHNRICLRSMLRQVLEDLGSAAGAAPRVQLELVADPAVAADPALVIMLLRNLLQNALQHTGGEVRVRLDTGSLTITDSGPGLPEQAQRLLRERSLPPGETTVLSGLGLYLVTLICERLAWALDVQSSPEGAVLGLRFDEHAQPKLPPESASAPPQ